MSKNSKYVFLVSVAILAFGSSVFATFDITKWQYYRDIEVPAGADFVKVTLPDNVANGGKDFSDIRIMTNNDRVEVPYFITRNAFIRSGEINRTILDQTTVNNSDYFIVDTAEQGIIHTGLRLNTIQPNFRRMVSVYSSPTLLPLNSSSWNLVTNKGYLFKFTDPNTLFTSGKDVVDFPANTSRYLKVVIDGGLEGPISINKVSVYGETRIDVPSYNRELPISVFNNPEKKTTEVTVDLGELGHITDSIIFNSNDGNYSRRVIIESRDNASSTWKYVGESSISNITTKLYVGASTKVSYPEQKTRYIRASIVNDDNRPLNLENTIQLQGPIVSAIFETRAGESYRLYYGNSLAQTPTYDIARISSYIEANKLPVGSLSLEAANSLYVAPPAPVVPFTEANKMVLNVFLVIIVVIIGGGIGWYLRIYIKKKDGPQGFDMTGEGQ